MVGLTGGIASGKDLVAGILRGLGARVIDADEIARALLEPGLPAYEDVVETFGKDILDAGGRINRRRLAALVFPDQERLNRLNTITHPRIIEEEKRQVEEIRSADPLAVIVINAALLIESGNYRVVDRVIVVDVPEDIQMERAMGKGLTEDEVRSRMKAQMPRKERLKYADIVIDNSGSIEETKMKIEEVYGTLKEIATSNLN